MNRFFLVGALAAATLAGCQTSDGMLVVDTDFQQSEHPIFGGNTNFEARHDATVSLHQLVQGGSAVSVSPFCSGTLIAADVVLTAAHCLDTQRRNRPNFQTMNPGDLAIYVGDDPSLDIIQHLYLVTDTEIYPGYDRLALRNDLALITLSAPVTEATPVPNLPAALTLTSADASNTSGTPLGVDYTGFGQTETGSSGVKLHIELTVDSLGCDVAAWGCYGDAGDPSTQFSSAQGGGGTCFGDSGGSGFVNRNGTWYVAGITSWGDQYCTGYGVNTNAAGFETYINNYVGVTPPPPAEVPPVADAGGPYSAFDGDPIVFDGSGSSDANGDAMTYSWDFGDGNTGTGVSPTHTYAGTGSWTVTLTVTDNDGSDVASTSATVTTAPSCDYTGTVSSSNKDDYVSLGNPAAGTALDASLTWDSAAANLNFYLQYENNRGRWKNAASSADGNPGVFEAISYTVPSSLAGSPYRWRVQRKSGTATWCIAP